MSCRTVHEILEQARDERLPALVQSALDSHLAACPDCARLAVLEDQLAQGLATLRESDERLELPAGFRREVKERLLASDRRTGPASSGWARGLTGVLAAAACLALAVIATTALREPGPEALTSVKPAASGAEPTQQAVSAPANARRPVEEGRGSFDPALAPLLYATPEVEVLYGGPRDSGLQPAAAHPRDPVEAEEQEGAHQRREYHF